jgi:hypothetical protein
VAEPGSRKPASARTAAENLDVFESEGSPPKMQDYMTTARLRQELERKGLKGFKRGGKVKKTGIAKVHKGERVLTAKQAKKAAPAKKNKVRQTMHEFKTGALHSGSKTGPKVKSRRQAVAIALNQARKGKK